MVDWATAGRVTARNNGRNAVVERAAAGMARNNGKNAVVERAKAGMAGTPSNLADGRLLGV